MILLNIWQSDSRAPSFWVLWPASQFKCKLFLEEHNETNETNSSQATPYAASPGRCEVSETDF